VEITPNYGGLVLVIWGAAQMILGNLAAQIFVTRTAFLVSLIGVVLFLGGMGLVRALGFPLFLMIFLFPIPAMLYAQITLPLQIFASSVAESVLNFVGIPVLRDGNILELAHQRISVVEACSGMRSLLSLSFLSLLYAYFFDSRIWMRGLLSAVTIPIAIAANAARVTATGLVGGFRPELAEGLFHIFEGWVLFWVALSLIVAFHRLVELVRRHNSETQPRSTGIPACVGFFSQAKWPAAVLSTILALQGSLFYGFSRGEAVAAARSLDGFPSAVGAWHMIQQEEIEKKVKDVLRADDYLTRQYAISPGETASLFVASFKSQRAGQTPHSPKNCLPGSGWIWSVSDTIFVNVAERNRPIMINRYVVSKGDTKAVVLYWYQSRDRVVASEYKAAAFVAWDAIRWNRTDTALVRVVVPVAGNRTDQATQSGIEFIQAFFTTLRQFLPA
jgi:exosortase D (VPLPA-CTERM-specific)